jgi:hypothetical protein
MRPILRERRDCSGLGSGSSLVDRDQRRRVWALAHCANCTGAVDRPRAVWLLRVRARMDEHGTALRKVRAGHVCAAIRWSVRWSRPAIPVARLSPPRRSPGATPVVRRFGDRRHHCLDHRSPSGIDSHHEFFGGLRASASHGPGRIQSTLRSGIQARCAVTHSLTGPPAGAVRAQCRRGHFCVPRQAFRRPGQSV